MTTATVGTLVYLISGPRAFPTKYFISAVLPHIFIYKTWIIP
jgi:hypothetical protein